MAAETNNSVFDVVIVGGGTAGLVLASRLRQTVLTPASYSQLCKTPVAWEFKTVPQVR